jgi:hypothetical protein
MMPARYRGRTDIWINGSYWLGSIIGTLAAFQLLNSLPANTGWWKSSSESTPRANRWSRSRDRSPKSVPRGKRHDARQTAHPHATGPARRGAG